jgi:antitoxin CcdA
LPCRPRLLPYSENRPRVRRVAEQSVADAAAEEKARLWKIENREAIQGFNDYIEKNGLPLEKFRQF